MRWAVFDAGFDLMVQLFEESKRKELAFDKLYSDAKVTDLDEKNCVKKATKKAKADDELMKRRNRKSGSRNRRLRKRTSAKTHHGSARYGTR